MRTTSVIGSLLLLSSLAPSRPARAHCQVPCGVFTDHARVAQLEEDLQTIKKAVSEMAALAPKRALQSQQQLIRWVMTKEHHAEHIMRVIADYFLAQKIKPPASADKAAQADYLERLKRHHAVMLAAMRTKQSSAAAEVTTLAKTIAAIAGYWPAPK